MCKNAGCYNCTGNVNRPITFIPPLCERFTTEGYYYDSGETFTKYGECHTLNKSGDCSGFEQCPPELPKLSLWTRIKHHFGYG